MRLITPALVFCLQFTYVWTTGGTTNDNNEDCGCSTARRDNLVSKVSSSDQTCESKNQCEPVAGEDNDVSHTLVEPEQETLLDGDIPIPKLASDSVISDAEDIAVLKTNPMLMIPGGDFFMGTVHPFIPPDGEGPLRPVRVDSFYMDKKEVSNKEFARFVSAANYITEVCLSDTCNM